MGRNTRAQRAHGKDIPAQPAHLMNVKHDFLPSVI
jgi:hypothetical protein